MADIDDVGKIIAVINPNLYCEGSKKNIKALKNIIKDNGLDVALQSLKDLKITPKSSQQYSIMYNSSQETLEPVYFWILDFLKELLGFKQDDILKITDNFTSSPGSGHFGELQQRATIMQQQASKIMGDVNTVIKSVLNLIYSLKEFQMRLSHYKMANSKDNSEAESGLLALKQIWLDQVDIKRGNTSIKALSFSGNAPFTMLIDAFMAAKSIDDVDKIDLNDRVKRLLKPRVAEFYEWRKRSDKELTKRYQIEKTYLKSQVAALRLYSRWAKPYLKAAEELNMKDQGRNPELVNIFNTIIMQLTLFAKKKFDFSQEIVDKSIPQVFKNIKIRDYYAVLIVDFEFRGIPQKIQQGQSGHYAFGGQVTVKFRAYALNGDEIALFMDKLDDSDLQTSFKLIEGMTDDTIKELQEDIDYFLKEEDAEEEQEKNTGDTNPFTALIFGDRKKPKKKEEKDKEKLEKLKKGVKPDSWEEEYARRGAVLSARKSAYNAFDVYKKGHGMASHPKPEEFK